MITPAMICLKSIGWSRVGWRWISWSCATGGVCTVFDLVADFLKILSEAFRGAARGGGEGGKSGENEGGDSKWFHSEPLLNEIMAVRNGEFVHPVEREHFSVTWVASFSPA